MPALIKVPELLIPIDESSVEPLYRQVYRGIRDAILSRALPAGTQLPSSRRLAGDLGLSRSTVLVAFSQLVAEGYIVGTVGSGSYVASQIPDRLLQVHDAPAGAAPIQREGPPAISQRAAALTKRPRRSPHLYPGAFWAGVPPVDQFPLKIWSGLAARRQRALGADSLWHGPPSGFGPLREAIVTHLASARGVRCEVHQVLIVASAQEALDITCRTLLDPGDPAWLEDPSWAGSRGALMIAGARIVPVPVDEQGLDVDRGIALAARARLAYVSPSHQYPMGVTLSLGRRLALLAWAAQNDAWIIEDDYDSEYRYAGRPITALQGLDSHGRVIYIGTFNKTIFPALRIAYMVVPSSLVEPMHRVRSIGGQHVPPVEQRILTDFIIEGHYARHLRRMCAIGRERRDALIAAAQRDLPGLLKVESRDTGLHTIGWLSPELDDVAVSTAANAQAVEAAALSRFFLGGPPRSGLVLGYAGLKPHEISAAMRRLATGIRSLL